MTIRGIGLGEQPNALLAFKSKTGAAKAIYPKSNISAAVSFAGESSQKPKRLLSKPHFWLSLLLLPGSLGSIAVSSGATTNRTPLVHSKERDPIGDNILQKSLHPINYVPAEEQFILSEKEKALYRDVEKLYRQVETRDPSSTDTHQIQQLKNVWDGIREKAAQGDRAYQTILQALWVNRMHIELTEPSPKLIRFYYDGFDKLIAQNNRQPHPELFSDSDQLVFPKRKFTCIRDGLVDPPLFKLTKKLSDAEFATEIQWRAIVGLFSYFANRESKNELIGPAEIQRLHEPTMHLLKTNPDENIQRFGNRLMLQIFTFLTPKQQEDYAQHAINSFLDSAPGTEKFAAMVTLPRIYDATSHLVQWQNLFLKARTSLNDNQFAFDETDWESKKYNIVLLGLLKDPYLSNNALSLDNSPLDIQQAAAWALGNPRSHQSLAMLNAMLSNPKIAPVAKEMALYSVAEHATIPALAEESLKIINIYASPGDSGIPESLQEAARSMQEKFKDKSLTEPDFYLNKLLKTEQEKQEYRALRNQYLAGSVRLNVLQRNIIDRSLLPFRQFLKEIVDKGGRHQIIPGPITNSDSYKGYFGFRSADGRLYDTIQGVSSEEGGAVTSANDFPPGGFNTFSHEFSHHLHQLVLDEEGISNFDIFKLYREALQDQRILDYYAKNNEYEFFAQGGESMDARYKNHSILFKDLFNNGFDSTDSHIRSWLKRTNPDLHQFIEGLRSIPLILSKLLQQRTPGETGGKSNPPEQKDKIPS